MKFQTQKGEILKIQQKKGRLAEQPPNQGLKGVFFLEICISFD
jgi:hypothetical protein